jgi:hypothetical protein
MLWSLRGITRSNLARMLDLRESSHDLVHIYEWITVLQFDLKVVLQLNCFAPCTA